MQLTPEERLMLVEKKDEIRKLTEEIIELSVEVVKNEIEIKKKVTGVLSLISTLGSFTTSKNLDTRAILGFIHQIFYNLELGMPEVSKVCLEFFCNFVNSITFKFTSKEFKVIIPKIELSAIKIESKLI